MVFSLSLSHKPAVSAIDETFERLIDEAQYRIGDLDTPEIVIDCSLVQWISSHAIDRLIRLHLEARRFEQCVVISNASDFACDVINLTRLDRIVSVRFDAAHERMSSPHFGS
ncbi:hypothetical protein [Planctomycetes bacterium K23_9]|uniref:STAS domain-containing protein n=1 Tax=Stieleria marina TaxID=1930275 RepID=A0A517NR75_9BACT|nr:hypothetical protein K239x_15510 [Planctomycetes bacterium K23_9]